MLAHRKAVGHAGDVVSDRARGIGPSLLMILRRQQPRLGDEGMEQVGYDAPCFVGHVRDLVMLIEIQAQKLLQFVLLALNRGAESDERRCRAHVIDSARRVGLDVFRGLAGEVDHQRADHAPHGFVHQPSRFDLRILAQHLFHVARENADLYKLLERKQAGTQAIVDVVIVVGDLIGEIDKLRFERRPPPLHETLANSAEHARVFQRTVLEDAFTRLEAQIEAVERGVALLEQVDDA